MNITESKIKKIKRVVRENGYMTLIHGLKDVCKTKKITLEIIELFRSLFNRKYVKEQINPLYDFLECLYTHVSKPEGDLYFLGIKISYTILN